MDSESAERSHMSHPPAAPALSRRTGRLPSRPFLSPSLVSPAPQDAEREPAPAPPRVCGELALWDV